MRLRMMMKKPPVFPEMEPAAALLGSPLEKTGSLFMFHRELVGFAWREYADAVLSHVEPCMECSETAEEILGYLNARPEGLDISLLCRSVWRIGVKGPAGERALYLTEDGDGSIFLYFLPTWKCSDSMSWREHQVSRILGDRDRLDVSDFGPEAVAEFIRTVMASYDKVEEYCNGIKYS